MREKIKEIKGKLSEMEIRELRIVLDELLRASKAGAIIVVEGASDRRSLRDLGVEGEIVLASIQPDVELVDSLANSLENLKTAEVIILSDWDVEGRKIERRLGRLFKSRGISVNTEYRRRIFKIVGKDVRSVENLSRYLESVL
jgi:5S rRNA maturation endonuclease (ribonuclease M5)